MGVVQMTRIRRIWPTLMAGLLVGCYRIPGTPREMPPLAERRLDQAIAVYLSPQLTLPTDMCDGCRKEFTETILSRAATELEAAGFRIVPKANDVHDFDLRMSIDSWQLEWDGESLAEQRCAVIMNARVTLVRRDGITANRALNYDLPKTDAGTFLPCGKSIYARIARDIANTVVGFEQAAEGAAFFAGAKVIHETRLTLSRGFVSVVGSDGDDARGYDASVMFDAAVKSSRVDLVAPWQFTKARDAVADGATSAAMGVQILDITIERLPRPTGSTDIGVTVTLSVRRPPLNTPILRSEGTSVSKVGFDAAVGEASATALTNLQNHPMFRAMAELAADPAKVEADAATAKAHSDPTSQVARLHVVGSKLFIVAPPRDVARGALFYVYGEPIPGTSERQRIGMVEANNVYDEVAEVAWYCPPQGHPDGIGNDVELPVAPVAPNAIGGIGRCLGEFLGGKLEDWDKTADTIDIVLNLGSEDDVRVADKYYVLGNPLLQQRMVVDFERLGSCVIKSDGISRHQSVCRLDKRRCHLGKDQFVRGGFVQAAELRTTARSDGSVQ
jgi:hypothetical protein